jgi:TolA-binding protein
MRKIIVTALLLCTGSIAFTQTSDEEKIKQTLEAERAAYATHNLEAWKNTWRQDGGAYTLFISPYGSTITKGWDSLKARIEKDFKAPSLYSDVKYDNISVRPYGNMALVTYNMMLTPVDASPTMYPYVTVQKLNNYQLLIKENDQWKTTTRIVSLPDASEGNFDHAAEDKLNGAGYDLLNAKKFSEAIEVFKLNVKLYPNSWNTFDSLGEAYAAAGNKKLAIENYERSIKINPKSETGIAALAKLKQK